MNESNEEYQLIRKIYYDILNGYTHLQSNEVNYFFKHLSEKESSYSNVIFVREYNKAKSLGLLPEKEKIDLLCKEGVWKYENEEKIFEYLEQLDSLQITKSKLIIKNQIKDFEEKINDLKKENESLTKERREVVGTTAEDYAFKKANEYILYLSLYKDEKLKHKFFDSEEDFWETDNDIIYKYFFIYKIYSDELSLSNLKKIAVSSFFMNSFLLSEDNVYRFYGKAIVELTQNQLDLYYIAKNYKSNLIKIGRHPPKNYRSLQEVVDWYENAGLSSNNKSKNQKGASGQTYIGASKEELKELTSKEAGAKTVDLVEEADKMGGNLSFKDILKIHGEI